MPDVLRYGYAAHLDLHGRMPSFSRPRSLLQVPGAFACVVQPPPTYPRPCPARRSVVTPSRTRCSGLSSIFARRPARDFVVPIAISARCARRFLPLHHGERSSRIEVVAGRVTIDSGPLLGWRMKRARICAPQRSARRVERYPVPPFRRARVRDPQNHAVISLIQRCVRIPVSADGDFADVTVRMRRSVRQAHPTSGTAIELCTAPPSGSASGAAQPQRDFASARAPDA